jgi:N-acetylmuramoyl-L-alanine amidase
MTEKPTEKFLGFVAAVKAATIEFPDLKPFIVAQAILECGRGTTILFADYSNPFGMHFHPFLAQYGIGVQYVACDGPGIYTKFHSFADAIKGYFAWFDNWEHYGDWRAKAKKGGLAFLKHIGPHYCPPGFTDEWIAAHGELDYADYISLRLLNEAQDLLDQASTPKPEEPQPPQSKKSYWVEDYQGGILRLVEEPGSIHRHEWRTDNVNTELAEAFAEAAKAGAGKRAVAGAFKELPELIPFPTEDPTPKSKKIVFIDPGHSEQHTGARGQNSDVQEEDENRRQALMLQEELAKYGIQSDIYDPMGDDLYSIGQQSKGYDAMISLHLNAYARKEFYTCTMCHPTKQSPNSKSAMVASKWAQAVSVAIGNPCFSGSAGWPKGVMAVGLSVLSGAASVNCPVFFLSEAEFIDDETSGSLPALRARLAKAMAAGAKVIAENI